MSPRMSAGALKLYSIAAHRGFADALVAGLTSRYGRDDAGLARLTLLLPSGRALRTVTEAFTRHAGEAGREGMLMPRMATVGDLDLDERLGPMFDPLAAADIPLAVEPTRRRLVLAEILGEALGSDAPAAALRHRRARELASMIDRLQVERIPPQELAGETVLAQLPELQDHWLRSLKTFLLVHEMWSAWLAERGLLDPAERRNLLLDAAARRWRASPPAGPVIAAGVTSAAPALAGLLKAVAELADGAVVLPDVDLSIDAAVWEELGRAGRAPEPGAASFGREDATTHPQYHLKLLLNRMGVSREEFQPWHRRGLSASPPERSKAIAAMFLPPRASAGWADLPERARRLAGVRLMETANPNEEAQAIALLVRRALEQPERRVAVVTPDRTLATRVVHHLRRWNIRADDSAGTPLSRTTAGRLALTMVEAVASRAAPVELMAFLQHPLVAAGEGRRDWLARTRQLELALRGPRLAEGLDAIGHAIARFEQRRGSGTEGADGGLAGWWQDTAAQLKPLFAAFGEKDVALADAARAIVDHGERLCGAGLWAREDGRALADFLEDLERNAPASSRIDTVDLAQFLADAMECCAVRPPYGGHPRVRIYGLIESRLARADLVICGGLNEGVWPQAEQSDGVLAPAIMRVLGVPGAQYRIGLAAHDLAAALGAPEVVLSRARRDERGPTIASRFLLRARALLGDQLGRHTVADIPELARGLDANLPAAPAYERPAPRPSREQRNVPLAVTALDRLRSDPFQFYAAHILGLPELEALDAEPGPAWQGSLAHKIMQRWLEARVAGKDVALQEIADEVLDALQSHPLVRALWQPRLDAALRWAEAEVLAGERAGRVPSAFEIRGEMTRNGVRIHGRADRIDRLPDGGLAIVDYKTGKPPSAATIAEGFALQLGLLGMIAERSAFAGHADAKVEALEYWSFQKSDKSSTGFGRVQSALKGGRSDPDLTSAEFIARTAVHLDDAIERWIIGSEPFTARLNPDYPGFATYDQLMRLAEWQGRGEDGEG
jgi:ATP-dependent helicase/nuclease subunit B